MNINRLVKIQGGAVQVIERNQDQHRCHTLPHSDVETAPIVPSVNIILGEDSG